MPTPDPYNVSSTDPQDFIYVSKKNWARKVNVEKNEQLVSLIDKPGPITGIVIWLFDTIVYLFLKLTFYLYDVTQYAFNWVNNITFGNFQGIIPASYGKGKVISTKFFRYTMNVLMPPFGILLSKGIYGWFSVLICMLMTYVHFLAGIIFAFVITSRNRYADQYEQYQIVQFEKKNPPEEEEEDISAFVSSIGFIIVLAIIFYFCFSFF